MLVELLSIVDPYCRPVAAPRLGSDVHHRRVLTWSFLLRHREPIRRTEVNIDIERERERERPVKETEIDVTEREYRRRLSPEYDQERRETYDVEYERPAPAGSRFETRDRDSTYDIEVERRHSAPEHVHVEARETVDPPQRDMGYYDEGGSYHSFRRGLERATDRVLHPFHGSSHHHHHHDREDVVVERDRIVDRDYEAGPSRSRGDVRYVERYGGPHTVTIPCHHIRVGDLLVLQGRPCQVIRITTSAHTGQHRYLGVDLFTKQLHEESSFVSNPAPSVIVQSMLGPIFKQYRVLDMREDGAVVAMTESGDVKQRLPVIDHDHLWSRLNDSFADGRGSVRVLVINDGGRELAVDMKVIHGARL